MIDNDAILRNFSVTIGPWGHTSNYDTWSVYQHLVNRVTQVESDQVKTRIITNFNQYFNLNNDDN